MTGEMHPSEVTQENYPIHFSVARSIKGRVEPFDHYQGPYVRTQSGCRLFLTSEDEATCAWWNERTDEFSSPFFVYTTRTNRDACRAAREVA